MCFKFLLEHFLTLARPPVYQRGAGSTLSHPHVKKCLSYCVTDLVPVIYCIPAINTICGCEMPLLLHLNWSQKPFITVCVSLLLPLSVVTKISSRCSERARRGVQWGHGSLSEEDRFGINSAHNPTERGRGGRGSKSRVTNGKVTKSRDCS